MTISADDLFIIVTHIPYSGFSGDTSQLYTNKNEAEIQVQQLNVSQPKNNRLIYEVMSLSDFIYTVEAEARESGAYNERTKDY